MRKYLLHILIISFVFAFQVSAFDKTDFEKAKDSNADLSGAELYNANLRDAYLENADLSDATLYGVLLKDAYLFGANLTQVKNLSINQLSEVETLYKAKLDPELKKQVKDKYPHLLKKPEYYDEE